MPPFRVSALRSATLRVAADAGLPLQFAVQELQRYLHRMTGVTLPIQRTAEPQSRPEIVLAYSAAAGSLPAPSAVANAAGFTIIPEAERVTLTGGSARATLAAAYALLQQLGCRWSMYGPEAETVPRVSDAAIELPRLDSAPRFDRLGYCSDIMTWHYTQPEHLHDRLPDDRLFIDWMGKTGGNAFFYIRHPFDTQLTIPELAPELERRGIEAEYGGHVIPLLLPRELFATHPEYFPQSPDGTRSEYGNLCASNAAALEVAAGNAVQYARDYSEMQALHIWGADLWDGGWCRCPACAPLGAQDQSLRVCNAVARGLVDAGWRHPVCYLAYHDTLAADLTVRPEATVVCEFAPRERCYGHALDDPECATNQRYARALEKYVQWFDGRVRLFEYYGDAILFFGCTVPLTRVIAADLEYYHRLGIREILMLQFGAYSTWAYPMNFTAFVAAAAPVSAPDADSRRFGVHAPTARTAFRDLEAIMAQVVTYGDIRRPPRDPAARRRLLARLEAALPRLAGVAEQLEAPEDAALRAYAGLVRYTQTVLEGVQHELRTGGSAESIYAGAQRLVEAVDRRFKGLWGTVDLPIIHSFYAAAAWQENEGA